MKSITSDSGDSENEINTRIFERGSKVTCIDRNSKFFLKSGIVEDNDLMHVRVDFEGIKIWLSQNTIILDS